MVKKDEKFNKKEIIYLDILKIFACLMVIVNHTNAFILDNNTFLNSTFCCVMFSICKVAVSLFFMITGALVLDKNYSYKKVLKCIFRVLVPVILCSLYFYIKVEGIHSINIIDFLKTILIKPYIYPYWYIYALIGLYLVLPFIQKMVKSFKNNDYIIFISIFLLVPSLISLLKIYLKFDISSYLQLAFFPMIVSTVICGNYISKIKLSKKVLISSICVFVLSYVIMFLSVYLPYLKSGKVVYILDAWNSFPAVLMSMSLFYIVRYIFENRDYSKNTVKVIMAVSSTTFGIYLIHMATIYNLYYWVFMQRLFSFNGVLGSITLNSIIFILCMAIIYILKKIPFVKKFL